MNNNELSIIIRNYDHFVQDIDFQQMPQRESEEYRQLVLQTSNLLFSEGLYSTPVEYTLEIFDESEFQQALTDLRQIDALSDEERQRLRFYIDVKSTCYPLRRRLPVDWTAWPWNMSRGDNSMDNTELVRQIIHDDYPYLGAAICYDLVEQAWNHDQFYTSVARNDLQQDFQYDVKSHMGDVEELKKGLDRFTDALYFAENHMLVGRQLGFDFLAQSVYDAMDTYIDRTYRHQQVDFAREMGAWLHEHWTVGEKHPSQERVELLYQTWQEMMKRHDVTTPDMRYSWNILTLDVLGMSMFSEEELNHSELDDDDIWDELEPND